MTEWIALCVSIATASWNFYMWLVARKTKVEVSLAPVLGLESLVGKVASITVINHSSHPIHPRRLVFELSNGTERYPSLVTVPRLAPILVDQIRPRDNASTILNEDDLTSLSFDRTLPVVLRLELADKQEFRSPAAIIDPGFIPS